jgi:hypothetical protein
MFDVFRPPRVLDEYLQVVEMLQECTEHEQISTHYMKWSHGAVLRTEYILSRW